MFGSRVWVLGSRVKFLRKKDSHLGGRARRALRWGSRVQGLYSLSRA